MSFHKWILSVDILCFFLSKLNRTIKSIIILIVSLYYINIFMLNIFLVYRNILTCNNLTMIDLKCVFI